MRNKLTITRDEEAITIQHGDIAKTGGIMVLTEEQAYNLESELKQMRENKHFTIAEVVL